MDGLGAGEGEEPNYVNATSSSGAAYGAAPSPAYGAPAFDVSAAPASSPAPAFAAPSAASQTTVSDALRWIREARWPWYDANTEPIEELARERKGTDGCAFIFIAIFVVMFAVIGDVMLVTGIANIAGLLADGATMTEALEEANAGDVVTSAIFGLPCTAMIAMWALHRMRHPKKLGEDAKVLARFDGMVAFRGRWLEDAIGMAAAQETPLPAWYDCNADNADDPDAVNDDPFDSSLSLVAFPVGAAFPAGAAGAATSANVGSVAAQGFVAQPMRPSFSAPVSVSPVPASAPASAPAPASAQPHPTLLFAFPVRAASDVWSAVWNEVSHQVGTCVAPRPEWAWSAAAQLAGRVDFGLNGPVPPNEGALRSGQFNNVVQVTMEADPSGRRARIVGMRAIEPEAVCIWHRRCAEAFSAGCSGGSIVVVSPTASPTAVPSWR